MRTPVVVELDPVADHATGVLLVLEAVPVDTRLLQGAALDHAVLLRTVRGDERLPQAVAAHQTRVAATGEDQAVVGPQQEGRTHPAQGAEARDQGLLQRRLSGLGLGAA